LLFTSDARSAFDNDATGELREQVRQVLVGTTVLAKRRRTQLVVCDSSSAALPPPFRDRMAVRAAIVLANFGRNDEPWRWSRSCRASDYATPRWRWRIHLYRGNPIRQRPVSDALTGEDGQGHCESQTGEMHLKRNDTRRQGEI
jgi:hypothetical protein